MQCDYQGDNKVTQLLQYYYDRHICGLAQAGYLQNVTEQEKQTSKETVIFQNLQSVLLPCMNTATLLVSILVY